jgi:hypothetical protein
LTYVIFGIYCYLNAEGLIDWQEFDPLTATIDQSKNGGTLGSLLRWYIGISTDIKGEIFFLCILIGLVVIPQILSFLMSGLLGCGKPPALVSKVTGFAVLSLVKFYCGLSAFAMSAGLFKIYNAYVHSVTLSTDDYVLISFPFVLLSTSFLLAASYYRGAEELRFIGASIQKGATGTILNRILNYMTRFTHR